MLTSILVAVLTAAPVVTATPGDVTRPSTPWEFSFGLMGGVRPDVIDAGGNGIISISRQTFSWLRPELMLGTGIYGLKDITVIIRIGTRIELPLENWHPYLWVAFAHQHECPASHFEHDPIGMLLGLSEHGVHHRSGLDTGVGVAYDLPRSPTQKVAGRIGVRATITHLLGEGAPRYLDLTATLGVLF